MMNDRKDMVLEGLYVMQESYEGNSVNFALAVISLLTIFLSFMQGLVHP